ncbi:GYDIA family GHMP kinase [Maribacter sp. HTCC2170]|uniref:GYDIA family GHMP kinase n=1 Tax=Maribacter sp. (strain HTCC2170 / KCCM 42371) TaxID=313603 RepID=UPI00006AE5FE|nr:GYDIA family GHMP kinase [Maribacter sp. HTCC2170]EAR00521.1 hypothetical protein FB2170_08449 [Maribacter sp. HTCC2170]
MKQNFYSNGKLLITGEYAVLDGAKAFAMPTKYGQSLSVLENKSKQIRWISLDEKNEVWFESIYDLESMVQISSNNSEISKTLLGIFVEAQKLNPNFLKNGSGFEVETKLTFPKEWGLGTSSTLIYNIAQWANVSPYKLLDSTFGGSGYDIACAMNNFPILYEIENGKPIVEQIHFEATFKDQLYFIYLNKKQNSREAIKKYYGEEFDRKELSKTISQITNSMITSTSINDFELLMSRHENEISKALKIPPIKTRLFSNYPRAIKSLGAWGGDFILAAGDESSIEFFYEKGYKTIISFSDMIL